MQVDSLPTEVSGIPGGGGGGCGDGREVQDRGIYIYTYLIHFVVQQKLTQPCKAVIVQSKEFLHNCRSDIERREPGVNDELLLFHVFKPKTYTSSFVLSLQCFETSYIFLTHLH